MSLEQDLARATANAVKAIIAPILADVKTLQTQIAGWETRWNDLGAMRERLAVLEVRQMTPGPEGPQGEPGEPGIIGVTGPRGADGQHGKDGAPGINGKDGLDGVHGKDADPLMVQAYLDKMLATWPRPKDGQDGKHGKDGLSPDDFDAIFEPDTRKLHIMFSRDGKPICGKDIHLDGLVIDRGVYVQGKDYEAGDVTSWNGSLWIATAPTSDRPGNGATPWRLAVKHGEKGSAGPEGKPGRDGRDLTQMGADGRKWS